MQQVRRLSLLLLAFFPALGSCTRQVEAGPTRELRVCADPNNLPFSNQREEGFENKLAELFAGELNATLAYTWHAQRRGFFRETLRSERCDVVMGIPSSLELALPSKPYYRSTYVFVTRKADDLTIESLDDAVLREVRIGVHMIGDDHMNTPPAHALAITRVRPQVDLPFLPFVYDISLGVRRGDTSFVRELEAVLDRRAPEIQAILDEYGVPQVHRRQRAAVP